MANKNKKKEIKYDFIQKFICLECKTQAVVCGPCEKCKGKEFYDVFVPVEVK